MALDEITLDELLGKLKSGYIGNINDYYMKVFIDYLEELKALRVELEKNSKALEVYKKAYETVCNSLSDKTACEWGYDEACMACRQRLGYIRTTSCVDFIKNFYLQKAREE